MTYLYILCLMTCYLIEKKANEWGFELITSSPLYPKSNGLAERTVGIAKNMLNNVLKAILIYI